MKGEAGRQTACEGWVDLERERKKNWQKAKGNFPFLMEKTASIMIHSDVIKDDCVCGFEYDFRLYHFLADCWVWFENKWMTNRL